METFNEIADEEVEVDLPAGEDEQEEVKDKLAELVFEKFRQAKGFRSRCEVQGKTVDDWLAKLDRAYNKVHEQDELEEFVGMRTYFGLVQIKTNMVSAYIRSKYINPENPPFKITPTPIVSLPKAKDEEAFQRVMLKLSEVLVEHDIPSEALVEGTFLRPEVAKFVEEQAKASKETFIEESMGLAEESCVKMTRLIKDQLVEGNFTNAMMESLLDLALYPTMVVSFDNEPVIEHYWDGNKIAERKTVRPSFRRVDPFNAYFAPNSSTAQDGDYFIEMVKRSKSQMSTFIGNEELGYFDDVLEEVIAEGKNEWLEDESLNLDIVDDELCVLRCQMLVRGGTLREYGVDIPEKDDFKYFNADIEVCDNKVIRCALTSHPYGKRTYFSASYKRIAGKPYGISVGMMVYDRQIAINRTQYGMMVNTMFSYGSAIEVNADAFDNPMEVNLRPYTRFYSNPTKDSGRGIIQHQVNMTFPQLFMQMTNEIRLADDECGLPAFLNGNAGLQGAGKTLGGLAMMTDNATLGLKECALNIDQYFIRPAVNLLYFRNLLTSKDKSIKADARVVATGLLGIESELNKAKEIEGIMPQSAQWSEGGVIPQELYKDLVRDYLKSKGVNTDKYIESDGSQSEIDEMKMNNMSPSLDGRSLRQM